jgi:excisionase family DNA binding protein
MTETLIHVRTAARTLNCTHQHIYNMIRDGKIIAIRLGSTNYRIVKESLDKFIQDARVNPEDYYA